jgi:hypothetical protein
MCALEQVQNILLLHNERLEAVELGAPPMLPAPRSAPTLRAVAPGSSNALLGNAHIVEPTAAEGQQLHQNTLQPATTGAALLEAADAEPANQGSGPSAPCRVPQESHHVEAAELHAHAAAMGARQQPVSAARCLKPRQKRSATAAHNPEGGKRAR